MNDAPDQPSLKDKPVDPDFLRIVVVLIAVLIAAFLLLFGLTQAGVSAFG